MAFSNPVQYTHTRLGSQRSKLPVKDAMSGVGNHLWTFDTPCRELLIINDSETDSLTILVTGPTGSVLMVVGPAEAYDERYPDFTSVNITAVGAWRAVVRSGVVL